MRLTWTEPACRWLRLISLPLLAVWTAAGVRPATGEPPASSPPSAVETAAGLIPQLGSESFAVRESTTSQLMKMGIEIKPALVGALDDSDPEIRMRARRVLAVIVAADYQHRLALFADDVNDKQHYDLPGWSRFRQFVGSDRGARSLFVEMQQAESELMAALETSPAAAERTLESRIRAAETAVRARNGGRGDSEGLGGVMALLFVGSDKSVKISADDACQLGNLTYQQTFQQAIAASRESESLKNILGLWIARDALPRNSDQNLYLAIRFNLKEGLEPAIRMLQQPAATSSGKPVALMTIAKFGGKEHLPIVEPFLAKPGIRGQIDIDGKQYTTQMRDIALYASLRCVQQDPKKFGFTQVAPRDRVLQQTEQALYQDAIIGFKSDDDRNEAFKQWNDWRAAHLPAPDAVKAPAKS